MLLQEIHHRVKNNMQVISSLLSLQTRFLKDEDAVGKFHESRNRIRTMALIHENLYRSQSLADIDFKDYVKVLAASLKNSLGNKIQKIDLVLDLDEVSLNTDTAIPCGLIINELVSNSFKYAFPGEGDGEVRISLKKRGPDLLELTVADNGTGIPEDVDLARPASLGLELVNLLVDQQLKGKIEMNAEGGTEFKITFKELKYKPRT